MKYHSNSYVANHFNILNTKKLPRISINYNKKTSRLVKALYVNKIVQGYLILNKLGISKILINSKYYRGVPYFSHFKVISSPSKNHSISLSALRVISKSLGNSILIIETDRGVINHLEALSYGVGGKLLGIVS